MVARSSSSQNAIVLVSGGIDSTACLHFFQKSGFNTSGLFIDYGQAARAREKRAVNAITSLLGVRTATIRIGGLPHSSTGELRGRNSLLVSAALFASKAGPCVLGLGIHSGTAYFDCSQTFVKLINALLREQTDGQVSLLAPFVGWLKRDVYDYAISERLPIEMTYSCEAGTNPTCGICTSCRDRRALGC